MQHIFTDNIGTISVSSGIVRIELCVQKKTSGTDKKPNEVSILAPTCSINMPVQDFADMIGQLQGLVDKLEKDGKLKRQPASQSRSQVFH